MRKIFLLLLIFCAAGCGKAKGPVYHIGVDASWYPLQLMGKEVNVFAFTNDVLAEIARREGVTFKRIPMSWDNLLWGLQEEQYDGMLSSLYPYVFNQDKYEFSSLYLGVGPVLVTGIDSDVDSIGDIAGKEIGVATREEEALLLAHDPEVIIRVYGSIPDVLQSVANGELDGALIGMLVATSYVADLYAERLRIVSQPLTEQGLRLITLHKANDRLIDLFNKGVADLKRDGTYMKLAEKWRITGESE